MPNSTVHVSYQQNSDPPFTYSPNGGDVEMDSAGQITFNRAGSGWSFTGITITPNTTDFTVTSLTEDEIVLTDSDATPGTYEYTITIETADGPQESDPQIINKN